MTMCHCWRPGELASNNNPLSVCERVVKKKTSTVSAFFAQCD